MNSPEVFAEMLDELRDDDFRPKPGDEKIPTLKAKPRGGNPSIDRARCFKVYQGRKVGEIKGIRERIKARKQAQQI